MTINSELWRVIATTSTQEQPLYTLIAKMREITNIDTRARLLDERDFLGWLRVELASPGSLEFAIGKSVLGLLWDEVKGSSAYYAPTMRGQAIPMVTGATVTGGDTLVADAAPEEYTRMVYRFDGLEFSEVGPLADNSQPGILPYPNYVLANVVTDSPESRSLPSLFLTLTS